MESCAFNFGMACLDQSTVLPTLLARLGASDIAIGFFRLATTLGMAIPAILAAHRIHGRPKHKRFMLTTCGLGRAGLLLLPPGILLLATHRPAVLVILMLAVVAIGLGILLPRGWAHDVAEKLGHSAPGRGNRQR